MQIEQAIFTSAQTQNSQGYHVVAASPGIDHKLAQALAMWCPSQNGLIDREIHAESLNCFPLLQEWIGLSRTVYGGAEYSDRGEFRLETNVLVIRRGQLAGYDHNPLILAKVARAAGHLRLRTEIPHQLSAIELPREISLPETTSRHGEMERWQDREMARSKDGEIERWRDRRQQRTIPPSCHLAISPSLRDLVAEVATLCGQRRVVVVGVDDAMEFVGHLIELLPTQSRLQFSFATGLKPSVHRPFSLQFLPGVNNDLVRELAARDMTCVMADA